MVYSKVSLLPTEGTLEYLRNVMSGSPIMFKFDQFHVPLIKFMGSVEESDVAECVPENMIWTAQTLGVTTVFDMNSASSKVCIALASPAIGQTILDLKKIGTPEPETAMSQYMPTASLVIISQLSGIPRQHRAFLNSLSNTMAQNQVLEFSYPMLTVETE